MKKVFLLLILLVVTFLFYKCTEQINSPTYESDISFNIHDKLLRIQDSTTIEISVPIGTDSCWAVKWTTNIGYIKMKGSKIIYYAPDFKGTAEVKVEIKDSNNNIHTNFTEILIFKQLIFLKADDVRFNPINIISEQWQSFINYIKSKNIKASLGLIGDSLEKGNDAYYSYLKDLVEKGNFEIWNHGYNHILNGINVDGEIYHEFWNTSLEYQKEHLLMTQNLAQENLGITLHTFGAPGNAIEDMTLVAIEEVDDIKVWFFGLEEFTNLNLQRLAEIEFPTHNPDFQQFINNYDAQKAYLTLQIHPNTWDGDRFSEFKNIIDFLILHEVTFINPYEYYQLLH